MPPCAKFMFNSYSTIMRTSQEWKTKPIRREAEADQTFVQVKVTHDNYVTYFR